eukprot:TRINITY_DN15744_c0_g1_i1.p1 TRINITY_DN15744_c0_g1~~TRINITY_DN15744_c0_g1_i1.p1  ORF type:complete len:203 (-),score=46.11 TRINITY_DN15744_c0_g1_i1:91-672(-)
MSSGSDTTFVRPNNYLVVDESKGDGDNSCVLLSPTTIEELSLVRGDLVKIKGKAPHETVCIVLAVDDIEHDKIRMNEVIRRNLQVKLGDVVSLYAAAEAKCAKAIYVLPFEDTIDLHSGDLFETFLKPYFLEAYRPVRKGNTFTVRGGEPIQSVEFKVMEIDPVTKDAYCIVGPETMIHCDGDPLKRLVDDVG